MAQDAGAPRDAGAVAKDGGLRGAADAGTTSTDLAAPDGGVPTGTTLTPDDEPVIRIPPTDAERAEGQPILAIEVTGNRRVAADDVAAYLKLKRGAGFSATLLATDVRALWDAGFFDDIKVDLSRTDQGVRLRLLVHERPNIKGLEFEGNDELDNDKLTEIIETKSNTILSVPAVRRSVQKIKDAYAEKGYFLAEVEYSLAPERDNEVTVKFKVIEHQAVTVRRINFIGNAHIPESELRETMQTGQGSFFSFGSGGSYRQDVFERDMLLLSGLYYDRGYLAVQIGTPRVMLTPDREGLELTVTIREGPRFKIRQLKVFEEDKDGKEVEPLGSRRVLREMVKAKSGEFFSRAEVLKDLQAVRTLYRDAGFYSVEAEPDVRIDTPNSQVDIIIPIHRGLLTKVERIEIKGNTKTRDKVFRREMEIEEGQLYSETRVEASKRRIQALGYFERVDVNTEIGSSPDKVVIYFEVGERPTGTFQVGAGFSSVESFILTAQVQQANLFGNGQSLALNLQASGLRQIASIRFFEPYFLDSDWSSSTELYNQVYVFPDFQRSSLGGSLTFGYALVQPWLRLSLTGTVEHNDVSTASGTSFLSASGTGVNFFRRLPLANLFNSGRTVSIRPTLVFDTRDNRLYPTSGVYLQLSSELADEVTGSEVEFLKNSFTGRFYYQLGGTVQGQPGSGFVFKTNTNLGLITSPSASGVPIFQRFFLGGILDMRGYRLRTLGPRLPLSQSLDVNAPPVQNGSTIGGNLQAYTNFEFEFPIVDKVGIRGVAFFDVGNTWNTESQYCNETPAPSFPAVVRPCFDASSLLNLRTSTGFGLRWFSPLGPLRFEYGIPLKPLPYEEKGVFEFTIGNFF